MEGGDFLPAVGTVELTTRGTTLPPLDAVLAKLVTTLKGHGLKERKTRSAHPGVNKLPFSSTLVGEKLLKIGLWGRITQN